MILAVVEPFALGVSGLTPGTTAFCSYQLNSLLRDHTEPHWGCRHSHCASCVTFIFSRSVCIKAAISFHPGKMCGSKSEAHPGCSLIGWNSYYWGKMRQTHTTQKVFLQIMHLEMYFITVLIFQGFCHPCSCSCISRVFARNFLICACSSDSVFFPLSFLYYIKNLQK